MSVVSCAFIPQNQKNMVWYIWGCYIGEPSAAVSPVTRVDEVKRNKDKNERVTYHDICTYAQNEGLVPIDLIQRDWFFNRILGFKREQVYLQSFIIISFFVIVTFVSGFVEGVFINSSLSIDMVRDIGFWMIILVVYTLTLVSVVIYRNTTRLFLLLFKSSIIKADKETFNKFSTRINAGLQNTFVLVCIYVAGLAIFYYQYTLMPLQTMNSWHVPGADGSVSLTSLLFIPLNLYHQILMVQFLIRSVSISIIMISFFLDNSMELDLSHPEAHKIRGIEIIGKFALMNFSLVFCLSLFLAASLYSNTQIYGFPMTNFYNIILIIEFYICSFASVFSPILLLI